MAVSEAIYGSTTSYVSSSAYYGFVPQNNQQPGNCGSIISWDIVNAKQQTRNGNCQNGAMEIDDDGCDAALVNNYCVIPDKALRGINPAVCTNSLDGHIPVSRFGALDRQSHYAEDARRRNRKRNNDGELMMPVEPDQFKKLRKGSGNSRTYHGRRFSKDGGLAEVRYKSSRLCIREGIEFEKQEEEEGEKGEFATVESCCWAAGNHSSLVNDDDKDKDLLLLNGNLKLISDLSDMEYEKMLLETHGCSAYHHHRFQLENLNTESEF